MRVYDGERRTLPILHWVDTHYKHRLEIYKWLIRNNITGKKFADWFYVNFKQSIPSMVAHIVKKVNSDVENRPLIVGKDVTL